MKFSSYKAEHLYIVNSCTFLRLHDEEQQVTLSSFMCTLPFSNTPPASFLPSFLPTLLKCAALLVHFNAKTHQDEKIISENSIGPEPMQTFIWVGIFVRLCMCSRTQMRVSTGRRWESRYSI